MNWTMPNDLRRQVQKKWDNGSLLSSMVTENDLFPMRLVFKRPTSPELSRCFDNVRQWISSLKKLEDSGYRIVWKEVNHPILGKNLLPKEIWIDSINDAIRTINKRREAERFQEIVDITKQSHSDILQWLSRYPLKSLKLCDVWEKLLQVLSWVQAHPRPGVYLRQVDVIGIHSKLIEEYRGVLSELLDMVLPDDAVNFNATGVLGFCRRYGFKDKPVRVRFRILDPNLSIFHGGTEQDITLTHDTFAKLVISVDKVFMTENEINFLSFPAVQNGLVIFGGGYGFDMIGQVEWLKKMPIYYWGDIDTHGFAILDQLRTSFPHVESILMDHGTLLAHREYWGTEEKPCNSELCRLTDDEKNLYDDLRFNRISTNLRLEQERIRFSELQSVLMHVTTCV